jgi:hypothetical protein
VARRRFQNGQLFKSGRRRKVWVGRWREDMLLEGGAIGQVRRWQVLGTVAGHPRQSSAPCAWAIAVCHSRCRLRWRGR